MTYLCSKCGREIHQYSEPYTVVVTTKNDFRPLKAKILFFLYSPLYFRGRQQKLRTHETCPTGPILPSRIFTKTFYLFAIMSMIVALEGIVEFFTQTYIIIPIYGIGYLTIVWSDYCLLCLGSFAACAAFMGYAYEAAN